MAGSARATSNAWRAKAWSRASDTRGDGASRFSDAVSAGATLSTHLGNGAHSTLPQLPNYIWDQMAEDRLAASFIVDGIHLAIRFCESALRAKGIERSVLVTDAVMPAMCAPGRV